MALRQKSTALWCLWNILGWNIQLIALHDCNVEAQWTTNYTADELAYAAELGAVRGPTTDFATLRGLGLGYKWIGAAYAESTGKLYGAPYDAASVLIVDPMQNTTDVTTLGGLGSGGDKWVGIAYANNTGKLYFAPLNAASVLIVDPIQNTTDVTTLGGLGSGGDKWIGIAYANNTGKLYGAPYDAASVLIVDPIQNTTNVTTLGGLGSGRDKWRGITYAPSTGKLYGAPYDAASVLIVDPMQNTTDVTTLGGLGSGGNKWNYAAYAENTGKLYFAPLNAASVLIVDPMQNTTDVATLGGLSSGGEKWRGIAYAPNTGKLYCTLDRASSVLIVNPMQNTFNFIRLDRDSSGENKWSGIAHAPNTGKLYCPPEAASSVLIVDPALRVNEAVLAPFRSISLLESTNNQLRITNDQLNRTINELQSTNNQQQITIDQQQHTIAQRQLVCAEGTTALIGECVPDCDNLQRRGVSCEPHCTALSAADSDNTDSSSESPDGSMIWIVAAIAAAVIIGIIIGVFVTRRRNRAGARERDHQRSAVKHSQQNPVFSVPQSASPTSVRNPHRIDDYLDVGGVSIHPEYEVPHQEHMYGEIDSDNTYEQPVAANSLYASPPKAERAMTGIDADAYVTGAAEYENRSVAPQHAASRAAARAVDEKDYVMDASTA